LNDGGHRRTQNDCANNNLHANIAGVNGTNVSGRFGLEAATFQLSFKREFYSF